MYDVENESANPFASTGIPDEVMCEMCDDLDRMRSEEMQNEPPATLKPATRARLAARQPRTLSPYVRGLLALGLRRERAARRAAESAAWRALEYLAGNRGKREKVTA